MTLIELVIVVAVAAMMLVIVAAISLPWMQKESMRSAVYDVQTYIQLAKIEAVSRNRECRFVVDTSTGVLRVFDGAGTDAATDTSDDLLLYETTLPDNVSFTDPQAGAAVTLEDIGSGSFQLEFTSDGIVNAGAGAVMLQGGQSYGRISVFAAGGVEVERWTGSAWYAGA
jgi:Tfp pilus assembly protein FimT